MKTHIKQVSILLLYTLVFNIISFIGYFIPAFFSHNFTGAIWLIFGILQLCFTILFFSAVPLTKMSNEKSVKDDLILYFIILSVLSSIIAIYMYTEGGSWFEYIFFNTFYPFIFTNLLDNLAVYICICLFENAIKTYCLYKNILCKSVLKKNSDISILVLALMVILYIVFFVLLQINVFGSL